LSNLRTHAATDVTVGFVLENAADIDFGVSDSVGVRISDSHELARSEPTNRQVDEVSIGRYLLQSDMTTLKHIWELSRVVEGSNRIAG